MFINCKRFNLNMKGEVFRIDHFLWYPTKKEYRRIPNAMSDNFNIWLYINRFGGKFPPIWYNTKTNESERFLIDDGNSDILYNIVYPIRGAKRASAVCHSAIIDKTLLKAKKVSLYDIENAIFDFRENFDFRDGNNVSIEKLELSCRTGYDYEYKKALKKWVTKESIFDMVSTMLDKRDYKILYLCDDATGEIKKDIMIYLTQLLNFDCSIKPLSFSTVLPKGVYFNFIDIIVSDVPSKDYGYIGWIRTKSLVKKREKHNEIYEMIEKCFMSGRTIDLQTPSKEEYTNESDKLSETKKQGISDSDELQENKTDSVNISLRETPYHKTRATTPEETENFPVKSQTNRQPRDDRKNSSISKPEENLFEMVGRGENTNKNECLSKRKDDTIINILDPTYDIKDLAKK